VKKALEKTVAKLIYLSPYLPDFSLIENLWSKLKIILRYLKTTNYQELGKAIEFAFGSALHRQILWVHLSLANTSTVELTIKISTPKRKNRGNTLNIPLRSR